MNIKSYIIDSENITGFSEYYNRLPKYFQKRVDIKHFQKEKNLSLCGGLLLEYVLKEQGNDLLLRDIQVGDNGKPYFADMAEFQFNISHSGTKVFLAVSENNIGCDVEFIRDINMKIADRYFSENERLYIKNAQNEAEQKERFFDLWTLKESFLKVRGAGLSLPLTSFDILIDDEIRIVQNAYLCEYKFGLFDFNDGYKYAICAENAKNNVISEPKLLNFNDI
jgi:4'-phosphopantetheinyl transferase